MSECTCYWVDVKPESVRMLNPACPEHGSVSPAPKQTQIVWPHIPRTPDARAS